MNKVFSNNLVYSSGRVLVNVWAFLTLKVMDRCLYVDPGVSDEIVIGEINTLNIMRRKIMNYITFFGCICKTQIDLLENSIKTLF